MAKIQSQAFAKSLSQDKFQKKPLYLLYGSEPKLVLDASKQLYKKIREIAGEDNCFHYLSAGPGSEDTPISEVVSQLNTLSMFGDGKVVFVGPMKKPLKEGMKILTEYVSNPNPDSTFIIAIVLDPKGIGEFEKSPLAKGVIDKGVAVKFAQMNIVEIKKWVVQQTKLKGLSINNMGVERLVELANKDLGRLAGEMEKLFSYAGEGKEITLKMVEEVVGDHREKMVWDFTGAVARRDFRGAVTTLNSLLDNNQPLQMILKMLTGEMIRIAAAKGYKQRGEPFEAFLAGMGGNAYPLKKAWANANAWKDGDIVKTLRAILKAYIDTMVAGASAQTALNTFLSGLPLRADMSARR